MIAKIKEARQVLDKQFEQIKPEKELLLLLGKKTKEVIGEITKNLRKKKIKAQVFVGGSFAKGTIIKKEKYDIDLFVRFDKKYKDEEISNLLSKSLPKSEKLERIHGSRDYFKLKLENNIEFEIIPVINIKKPSEARNITDLSYFHVKYVENKIKKQKNLAKEIMLAKAFTHYSKSYGAESYIHGFSGYAVELLIIHYKSLLNFIQAILKDDEEKLILDTEKHYKNKIEVKMLMNFSKMNSPIVLIDPTFKDRNALAGLSKETLDVFKKACSAFLSRPSAEFFIKKDTERDFEFKHKSNITEVVKLEVSTKRQPGDIAGTKMKKFYDFLLNQMKRYFDLKDSAFIYNEEANKSRILIHSIPKKEIIFPGPPIAMKEQFQKFKKMHKKLIIKNNISSALEPGYKSFKEYLQVFQAKNEKILDSMDVSQIEIL